MRASHARGFVRLVLTSVACAATLSCRATPTHRTFSSPEDAVKALTAAAKAADLDQLRAIFGPDSNDLIDSSDAVTARRNRDVFLVAAKEGWRLEDQGPAAKTLVVGHEQWPFPVPLVKDGTGWRFDTAAGKEEIIARRIGRNELAAIRISRTYVAAQRLYARQGHDGKPAGLYAARLRSDAGKQNGLYWPAVRGQKLSPIGDLLAQASPEDRATATNRPASSPFHGYYFKILTGQGPDAPGGAKNYIVNGDMSGGFALVAWPAEYDVTGVMTFIVNQEGVVREKDLGSGTDAAARAMTAYNPDGSWAIVQ
jgi:hypothetical protein